MNWKFKQLFRDWDWMNTKNVPDKIILTPPVSVLTVEKANIRYEKFR